MSSKNIRTILSAVRKIFTYKNIRIVLSAAILILLCSAGYPVRPVAGPEPSPLYVESLEILRGSGIALPEEMRRYPGSIRLGDAAEWCMQLYRHYAPYPVPLRPKAAIYSDPGYISIQEMLSLDVIEIYPEFSYTSATRPTGQLFARMLTGMHNRIEADAFSSWYAGVSVEDAVALLAPVYRIATGSIMETASVPAYGDLYRGLSLPAAGTISRGQFGAMTRRLYDTAMDILGVDAPRAFPFVDSPDAPLLRAGVAGACEDLLRALALYLPESVDGQDAVIEIGRMAAHFAGRRPVVKECRSVQNDRPYPWYLDQGDTSPCAEYNCAPCCAAMAAHWHDQALTLDPSILRQQKPAACGCWTTDDIKECLAHYGVPIAVAPMEGEDAMLAAIEDGCLLLLVVDLGQGSHTILAKGYRRLGGDVWLTCYDPASWGRQDALGYPIGQDVEYHIRYLIDVSQWDFLIRIFPTHAIPPSAPSDTA